MTSSTMQPRTTETAAADRNFYRFRSQWRLPGPCEEVFRVLGDLDGYPAWWPQIRAVRPLGADTRLVTCRSLLPYDLDISIRLSQCDPQTGILEAGLDGDLRGFSRWTLTASSTGTLAVFDEEVIANKALLRRLAPLARPAFTGNHTLMMRHGRRGLAAYLARMGPGREPQTPAV